MEEKALSKNQIEAEKMRKEATRRFLVINSGQKIIKRSGREESTSSGNKQ